MADDPGEVIELAGRLMAVPSPNHLPPSVIPLDRVAEIAYSRDVRVIVDVAAQLPSVRSAEIPHTWLMPYLSYWMEDVSLIVRVEKVIAYRRGLIQSDHCGVPARNRDLPGLEVVERFQRVQRSDGPRATVIYRWHRKD